MFLSSRFHTVCLGCRKITKIIDNKFQIFIFRNMSSEDEALARQLQQLEFQEQRRRNEEQRHADEELARRLMQEDLQRERAVSQTVGHEYVL